MNRWVKITIGLQTALLISLVIYARIKAEEAEKQTAYAVVQTQLAQRNAEMAEMEAARAEKMAAEARRAENDAEEMRLTVAETTAELLKCSSKNK